MSILSNIFRRSNNVANKLASDKQLRNTVSKGIERRNKESREYVISTLKMNGYTQEQAEKFLSIMLKK